MIKSVFFLFAIALTVAGCSPATLPSFQSVRAKNQSSDFDLLDRQGRILSRVRRDFNSRHFRWVSLVEVPAAAREVFLVSEDRRFYSHGGVDLAAVVASVWQRAFYGSSRGGSTLTMQLARLLDSSIGGGWAGKINQVRAARALEAAWTKDQIFEAYLNLVPFRGELRGLETASKAFFDKPASRLYPGEAAYLAALLRGPNAPHQRVVSRACGLVADECMRIRAFSGKTDVARLEPREDLAPHWARLEAKRASGDRAVSDIDGDLQRFAVDTLMTQLGRLENRNLRDGAVLVLENRTGAVVAYVGSSGDLSRSPAVDGVQAHRQAGSVLKPFLYGLAIDRGLLEETSWIEDAAVDIVFPNGTYRPLNHDRQFRGWVTVREALGSSLNVPAVKTLRLINDESFWRLLRDLGLGPLAPPEQYGPALALGVADLSLWDLTHAYRVLANGGANPESQRTRQFKGSTAKTLERILSDKDNREAGFGWSTVLETGFPVAAKTGTSKDMRDNWCFGWSRDYTVGVWVGNFEGDPMWDVSGVTGAAPVWARVVRWLHENRAPQGLEIAPAPPAIAKADAPMRFPKPEITYPANGLVLALDPDLPAKVQRLPLLASGAGADVVWKIDGRVVSRGERTTWKLEKGRHKISLSDFPGLVALDEVEIFVK